MNITKLIESSKRIEAYRPSPSLESLAASLGIPVREILKLDANENMFLDREVMRETLVEVAYVTDPRLYPQGEEENLQKLLAKLNNIKPSQIVVSVGADQVIEILFSLLQRGELVTAVSPTFSMYPRAALQRELMYREATLEKDFSLNIEKTLNIANGSSILVICNPNNPTGNQFPRDDILELVDNFGGLVLIDEAYQEYSNYS
ncbi:MAG: aminotransferase class I/II-fold pyridoxal phosphate-dependent enzyme, partial [Promethearchaeota archaeon]